MDTTALLLDVTAATTGLVSRAFNLARKPPKNDAALARRSSAIVAAFVDDGLDKLPGWADAPEAERDKVTEGFKALVGIIARSVRR